MFSNYRTLKHGTATNRFEADLLNDLDKLDIFKPKVRTTSKRLVKIIPDHRSGSALALGANNPPKIDF